MIGGQGLCSAAKRHFPQADLHGGKPDLTQVEVQGEPPFLELQGDIVSTLTFSMEQDPIALDALELQGDHVFEGAQQLLIEPVQQGAPAIKVSNIGFWHREREREKSMHVLLISSSFSQLSCCPFYRHIFDIWKDLLFEGEEYRLDPF